MKAKKSLGQNFLNDNNILNKIANSTNAKKGDLIIEIGPGTGKLTKKLLETGANVIAFELDERMHECLDCLENAQLKVFYMDFLSVDLSSLIDFNKYKNTYIIANIPYYISTPILKKIVQNKDYFNEVVLLVQKEYAERVCACCGTKSYDSLTVFIDFYYDASILFPVGRNCFVPVPNVDSAVIKLTPHIEYNIDSQDFMKFINLCFQQKRKNLKNNVGSNVWSIIKDYLVLIGYNENVRAEQLNINQFIELYNILKK